MKNICDNCGQSEKGNYKTFYQKFEGKKGGVIERMVTMCWECLDGKPVSGKTDAQMFEHISTPFWVHAGLKPKPREKAQLKYMKDHNMTWGDMRKARYAGMPMTNEGVKQFQQHVDKYGRRNAPEKPFKKASN